jgi:hypothetical protein
MDFGVRLEYKWPSAPGGQFTKGRNNTATKKPKSAKRLKSPKKLEAKKPLLSSFSFGASNPAGR